MGKKRLGIFLFILVALITISASSQVAEAGCCVGITGCDVKNIEFGEQCSPGQVYNNVDCEAIPECSIGICCHDQPMNHAMYKTTCTAIGGEFHDFGPFDFDPGKLEGNTASICDLGLPPCTYLSCEGENTDSCLCGLTSMDVTSATYCCQSDNLVYATESLCRTSPSCAVTTFFSLRGRIQDATPTSPTFGLGLGGVSVQGGGKTTVTDENGDFILSGIPAGTSGIILAAFQGAVNSTSFGPLQTDVADIFLTLLFEAPQIEGEPDCTDGIDGDGDQGGVTTIGLYNPDACDPDCGITATLVREADFATEENAAENCQDRLDNDCDGLIDYDDYDSTTYVPATQFGGCFIDRSVCGDGTVQFPNSNLVFEQCDAQYDSLKNKIPQEVALANGSIIQLYGDDERCPGRCVAPGDPDQCKCSYEAECGNPHVDEPQEDCDGGEYDPVNDIWTGSISYGTGVSPSECTVCGTPQSAFPCQCESGARCGDGEVDEPYETCDPPGQVGACNILAPDGTTGTANCPADCRCPPGPPECGDNKVDPGEDCDGVYEPLGGGYIWTSFKTNKFGCTLETCGTYHTDPALGGTDITTDAGTQHIDPCQCPEVCSWQPDGPNLTTVEAEYLKKNITLFWTESCEDTNEFYQVYRCDTGNDMGSLDVCDPITEGTVLATLPKGTVRYTDGTFQPETRYCYFVQGSYDVEGLTNLAIQPADYAIDPIVHCINTGHEKCLEPHKFGYGMPEFEQFCSEGNERRKCSEERKDVFYVNDAIDPPTETGSLLAPSGVEGMIDCDVPPEGADPEAEYFCAGPYPSGYDKAGKTECIASAQCDMCSDSFGLFSFSYTSAFEYVGEAFDYNRDGRPFPCDKIRPCYLDYTKSNTDQFKTVTKDTVCYDLKSEKACTDVNTEFPNLNCSWNPHPRFAELGIGVCKTDVIENQECGRCHDPHNNVYGMCTKEMCGLYGRCYFDKISGSPWNNVGTDDTEDDGYDAGDDTTFEDDGSSTFRCTHERHISCEHYDSEEDCVNSGSKHSTDGETQTNSNVTVDTDGMNVPYGLSEIYFKTGVTNRVDIESDDYFGYGKCRWTKTYEERVVNLSASNFTIANDDPAVCMKNSDGSPPTVDIEELPDKPDIEEHFLEWRSDCSGELECRKDITEPNTSFLNLDVFSETPDRINGGLRIEVQVRDDLAFLVEEEYLPTNDYYPITFACIATAGQECYPNGTAEREAFLNEDLDPARWDKQNAIHAGNIGLGPGIEFNETSQSLTTSGIYELYWFSEDGAHNLEVVRHATIDVDATSPAVTFIISNTSFEISPDFWRTNVTLTMNVEDEAGAAVCSGQLQVPGATEDSYEEVQADQSFTEEFGTTWSRNFTFLTDGQYFFDYRCEDDVGNVAEGKKDFIVDGDQSITSPKPKGTFNISDFPLTLSVNTGKRAECKYLYSPESIPEFEEEIYDSQVWRERQFELFNNFGMEYFTNTGTNPELEGLTHNSGVLSTESGYHRYYVRCYFPEEDVVRGNRADEIRFAIDNIPPVTAFSTMWSPFDNWYNQDVFVTLLCDDPLIQGSGFDWQFKGCENNIFFCKGLDCDQSGLNEFIPYSSNNKPFINETTYLTFYSIDGGNNTEPLALHNKNVIFQIDKVPADLNVKFFDQEGVEEDILRMGVDYTIQINASKELMNAEISQPLLSLNSPSLITSPPSSLTDPVLFFDASDDRKMWTSPFRIEFVTDNRGFEGEGLFEAFVQDFHNVSSSLSFFVPIDTEPPRPPVLDPALEDPREDSAYEQMGFPLHYYNGTYYTNENEVFITGRTDELLDIIATVDVEENRKEVFFTQTETGVEYNTNIVSGIGNRLILELDVTSQVNDQMFFGFDSIETQIGTMTTYGNYGKFYDITSLVFSGLVDAPFTDVYVNPELEGNGLGTGKAIFFYNKSAPSLWFGTWVPLTEFEINLLFFKVFDEARNLARYPDLLDDPSRLSIFYDPIPPTVLSHFPLSGTTTINSFAAELVIKKEIRGSPLDVDDINFTVNEIDVPFTVDELLPDEAYRYYRIWHNMPDQFDGEYRFSIKVHDRAGNEADDSVVASEWTTIVDQSAPIRPEFTLIGGTEFEGRWYIKENPGFTLDFRANEAPISVVGVALNSSPTDNEAASCTQMLDEQEGPIFNMYTCEFALTLGAESIFGTDYSLIVEADKFLDDGSTSRGMWDDGMQFTVDPHPPQVREISFNHRIRDNFAIPLVADILNELHPLKGTVEFAGVTYSYPNISAIGFDGLYTFVWDIPNLNKTSEGFHTLRITIEDYAGNSVEITEEVYLDLTPPRVENVGLNVSGSVVLASGEGQELTIEYATRRTLVTISGDFLDDDIESAWISPGEFNEELQRYEETTDVSFIYDDEGIPRGFTVDTSIRGAHGQTELNQITLLVKDKAGHTSTKTINIRKDLEAPETPLFSIGGPGFQIGTSLVFSFDVAEPDDEVDEGEEVTLVLSTNKPGYCMYRYGLNDYFPMSSNPEDVSEIHIKELGQLSEGEYIYEFYCASDADEPEEVEREYTFTVGEEDKVEICHITSGDPDTYEDLEVSTSALQGHLAHGDYEGECESGNEEG